MSAIPTSADALLTRKRTAAALTESGFKIAVATLASKASRGGGPPYQLFGRIPLYRWANSLKWAHSKLSALRRSSSEGDAIDQAARAKSESITGAAEVTVPDRTPLRRRARKRADLHPQSDAPANSGATT